MKKVAIILRGHIRSSFTNLDLYNLIDNLNNLYNIDIYIHTWNFKEAKSSWRPLNLMDKRRPINEIMIKDYFGIYAEKIKNIFIDNDSKINLLGDTTGKIKNCPIAKIAWKRMWYGMYKNMDYVKNTNINYDFIINTRFDLFNNSNNLNLNIILDILKNSNDFSKINFYHQKLETGIDNFFYGDLEKICQLTKDFHENLDSILEEFSMLVKCNQEFYSYYQALKINDKDNLERIKNDILKNNIIE